MWYLALTREGSQGVCEVSPLGHTSIPGPLNETKRILASGRLAAELTASEQGVKLSFTSPFSPSRTEGDAQHQAKGGPGSPP